ncbi:MAG: LamG-like jellyroll fold domain-containing protein, partial [Prosthecobacter sp.]|nr:LamG-like jellyroll fold domain-containing protein [Prosthecobacter sp.]
LATVAVITLAFVFWPRETIDTEATSNGVAMLSQTMDAEFAQNSLRSGDTINPGTIKLAKGLAQIEFFSGATALIEGSAEIEVISAWEARCVSGRVRLHVPPAAKGFLMHAPGMKLEDLGTEFALNVKDNASAVHVFEGEVIAHTDKAPSSLKEGMTLGQTTADFLPISELQGLVKQRQGQRHADWQKWSQEARKDPRLIAYYTFKHWPDDRWDRLVNNFAEPRRKERAGGAVGAQWTQGRWPEKEALEFKRPGDRVRLNLDGTYQALTLACWVKVDSVDKKYNSLLLTDGYDNGEPHWQIFEDGSLMFSIAYRPDSQIKAGKYNQMYYSKPVFTADSLGRWHHLAVCYDNQSGAVIQYFDGQEVSREISALHQPGRDIAFGPCEIGNWGLPTAGHPFPIRNLNGAIDEFAIYSAVQGADEVKAMFEAGKVE